MTNDEPINVEEEIFNEFNQFQHPSQNPATSCINNAIAIADSNGILRFVNSAFIKICGYQEEKDITGKPAYCFWEHGEQSEKILHGIKHGFDWEGKINIKKKDKSLVETQLSVNIIKDNKHRPSSVVFSHIDITPQKKIKKELADAIEKASEYEKLYNLLAYNSNDIVWLMDLNLNFIYISPSEEHFMGYSPEERMTIPFEKLYKPESARFVRKILKEKINNYYNKGENLPQIFELEGIHKDGHTVEFEVTAKFLLDGQSKIIGIQGTSRDISERKLAEKSKNHLLDLYKKSETSDIDSILKLGLENAIELTQSKIGFFHFINPDQQTISLQIWSASTMKMCDVPTKDLHYSIDKAGVWIDCLLQKKAVIHNDYKELPHKKGLPQGHVTIIRLASVPIFENDMVVAIIGVGNKKNDYTDKDIALLTSYSINIWNITRRKKTEIANRKLKTAAECLKTCIVITDVKGQIEYANPYFTECSGYFYEEYIGKKTNILKSGFHDQLFYENLWKRITSGKTWEGELCNKKKNGDLYWEVAIISPITNDSGEIANYVAVKTDITELKKINEELVKAKNKAEESDQLKTAFLQNMSHEIRTPLNAIMGFSKLLEKPDLSELKLKNYIDIINKSSNQLLNVVSDILTMAHIQTNQEKLNIQTICLNQIVADLIVLFQNQANDKNIKISSYPGLSDEQSEIYTDSAKLIQIMTSLFSNALKFTQEGFVELGYKIKKDAPYSKSLLEFYIKDSGVGIKPEQHSQIFEQFRQADLSINKNYGGTGLGLSISKGFVELLGGKIWVESEPDRGSIFYFTIPYKPVNNFEIVYEKTGNIGSSPCVLVAEDEEYNFLYIEEILIDLHLKIIHTKNGIDTIEICKTNPQIELVLMDIKMPFMDGYHAALQIKEFRPDLPIIAQSAYAMQHEKERYSGQAFDDYITKPIEEKELKQKILKTFKKKSTNINLGT